MRKLHSASIFVCTLLVAGNAFAASFIVPTDRELVRAAKAIVIATAQGSYAERVDERMINTVYLFRVDEVIKGEVPLQELRVAEPGGMIGTEGIIFPGAPSYAPGERALVFLDVNKQGDFRTWSMGIGKFNFVRDAHGKRLLMRGQGDEAVFGWTAAGTPHHEVIRAEEKFLQFVRDEACGGVGDTDYLVDESTVVWQPKVKANVNGSGFHACDYASGIGGFAGACGAKWKDIFDQPGGGGSVSFTLVGSQSGGVNGPTGVDAGMAAWNSNPLSNVNLGTGSGSSQIKFDDNAGTGACGGAAVGCANTGFSSPSFTFDGGTFAQMVQVTVSFKVGFTSNQTLFNQVACHEIGHGLGIRHSNEGTPNAGTAVMMSVANASSPFGANLMSWDIDAVQTMYNPSPGVTCTNVGVPTAQANPPSIASGASSQLSASATGTGVTYTWFTGSPGDTSTQVGTGSPLTVSPTVTTNYWVRASGTCGPAQNSASSVTVTVQTCQPTTTVTASANPPSISPGGQSVLTASANGTNPQIQWYTGDPPGQILNGATGVQITVSGFDSTTKFFAKATNACGGPVNSNVVTVTVACQNVEISSAFALPSTITAGATTTLRVNAFGTGLTYQWFFGTKGNTSNPVPGATSFQFSANPTQTTTFWVRVNGQCGGPVDSDTITVTVVAQCVNPSGAVATANPLTIAPGATTNLSATANGTGLTFQWFIGTPPNGSAISGATNPTLAQQPAATTTYFVRVSGQCGSPIDSNAVTVTVSAACVNPSIATQPASKSIFLGTTATLTVGGAGTAPLHYQWFEGATGETSKPRGTDSASFTSGPLMTRTQYWVRVTGNCGQPVFSNTATVDVKSGRPRPVKH